MMKNSTREDTIRYWNESADTYSNRQQGRMPDAIISDLVSSGALSPELDVCELGPGPGTYSARIAPHVRSLTCVDASENMLAKLKRNTAHLGNIEPVLSDFADYRPGKVFDTTVAALCPGTHTEESIRQMCSMTKGTCVYIMWADMCWDGIYRETWKKFTGTPYPYQRNSLITENLTAMGIPYREKMYSQFLTVDFPFQVAVDKLIRSFARLTDVPLSQEKASEYLEIYRRGDRFSVDRTNRMRVVTWSVPESDVVHDA